ncbi:hypothetical protein TrRE_jg9649, partial [Triparma retinervis]
LESNIKLVENNARVGAGVALAVKEIEMEEMEREGKVGKIVSYPDFDNDDDDNDDDDDDEDEDEDEDEDDDSYSGAPTSHLPPFTSPPIIVMGGSVIDMVAKPSSPLVLSTSNPGSMSTSHGGVGRNIVETMGRLLPPSLLPSVAFYSAVGPDAWGSSLTSSLDGVYGLPVVRANVIAGRRTATYLAFMDGGNDLHCAVADTRVLRDIPAPDKGDLARAEYFVFDGNPRVGRLRRALGGVGTETMVVFEPTSVAKAGKIARAGLLGRVNIMTPNGEEVMAMGRALG